MSACSTFSMIHLHRTALPLVGAHEHCFWCRRSTSSEVYCCQVGTLPPHIASITILGIPGWAPTEYEWPESWTSFHLGCDPSLQVWLPGMKKMSHTALISEELAGWIGRLHVPGSSWTPHSPNHARITGVLHIVEPLRSA